MLTAAEVRRMPRSELEALLGSGHAIRASEVAGAAYRGVSLGLPRLVERLTWTTFQKAFVRDEQLGCIRGWNVRLEQRGVDARSVPRQRHGAPWTFGHFRVSDAPARVPAGCRGLLLDYGAFASRLDPMARLRDPVVAVNEGSADLLLGWSYLELGDRIVPTPSFFTLEREEPVAYVPTPRT